MLRKILIVIVFSLISLFAAAKNNLPTPHKTLQQLDTIVATVNSDIITQNEFDNALAFTKKQFKERHLPTPKESILRKKVLENLIDRQLQLQLAEQHGIKTNKEEVRKHIQMIAAHNHVTLSQLKAQVAAQGFSFATFEKRIHDQILMGKVQRQMVQGSVSVTKKDIQAFRSKQSDDLKTRLYHVGDAMIPVANIKDPAQRSKAHSQALSLMRDIRKGSSVADAVKKYHAQYSDLGFRRLNDLPSIFSKPIVSAKTGGIAGPVLAPNGYHILYLIATKSGVSQLSDKQVQNILMQKKYEEAINNSLKKIRKNAYIKINPNYE